MIKINFSNYKEFKTLKTKKEFYITEIIKLSMIITSLSIFDFGVQYDNLFFYSLGLLLIIKMPDFGFCFFNYKFYKEEWKKDLTYLLDEMRDIELMLKQNK